MTHLRLCHAPGADETPESLKFPQIMRARGPAEGEVTVDAIEAAEDALRRVERQMASLKSAVEDVFQLPLHDDWPPAAA